MAVKISTGSPAIEMFDVVISDIRSGKVNRRRFRTREMANKYIDEFWSGFQTGGNGKVRDPKDYRVESSTS